MIIDMDGTETGLLANVVGEDKDIAYEPDVEFVRANLVATLGSWADVDADAMIAAVSDARCAGSRSPDRPSSM